jgi:hypothetical protein
MDEKLPLDRHARFRRLNDYLAAKAPAGKLPGRQHIDPTEIADLLPYLTLLDVVPQATGETRLRVRLAGTQVVEHHGSEPTGRYLDEIFAGPDGIEIIAKLLEPVTTHRPNHRRAAVAVPGRDHVWYERVAFPLARDGKHVDMLAVLFVVEQHETGDG